MSVTCLIFLSYKDQISAYLKNWGKEAISVPVENSLQIAMVIINELVGMGEYPCIHKK